jgi:hypothetical protein
VLLVTEDPEPEALIRASDGAEGGGIFRVRPGDQFPEFTVVRVDSRGMTVSVAGRGYFYPVGGMAIGTQPPAATSRPGGQTAAGGAQAPTPRPAPPSPAGASH